MRRMNWKIIYKRLQEPQMLYSDEGKSVCVIGTYSKEEAFQKIKQELKDFFGGRSAEYKRLISLDQLKVALLRRPIEAENDDMDADYIAEDIKATIPRPNDVWVFHTHIKLKKIPNFKTVEEEADFWDTHDSTEYIDWTKAVKIDFSNLRLTNPKRIQRKRTKGWRMPGGTIYVGRPSEFGNPYKVGDLSLDAKYPVTPAQAVGFFTFLIRHDYTYRDKVKEKLKGRNLACWCPLLDEDGEKYPCHADVLLEIANE